jgi:NhaP-type Na+/H+ or K+/H+ antiporter
VIAAAEGFSFLDPYATTVLFVGAAIFLAVAALAVQEGRAFSAALVYLAFGAAFGALTGVLDIATIDLEGDAELIEHLAEFAVVVALFGTGLKIDRPFARPVWSSALRLLAIVMPLTIAAVALFGSEVMGLSLGAAIILGAVLAPTDPVLAGDVGVSEPGKGDGPEANVALTTEAGLNDGLAFPFIFLGVFVATRDGTGWLGTWAAADLVYAVVVGLGVGFLAGRALAAESVRRRERGLLERDLDGFLALAAVLAVYGLVEVLGGYGFLAAFTAGLGFRHYDPDHDHNPRVYAGADAAEKLSELAIVLVVGLALTQGGLGVPGVEGWLLVALLLLVIRPIATALAFLRSGWTWKERLYVGWFGVRGIGSIYYAAFIFAADYLDTSESRVILWTVIVAAAVSIVVHGTTASPLTRRWVPSTTSDR